MKKLIPVLICLFALSCTPKSEKKRNPPVSDDEETESGEWNDKAVAERDKGNYVMAKYYNRKAISYENVSEESKCIMTRNLALNHKSLQEFDSAKMVLNRVLSFVTEGTYYYFITKSELFLLDNNVEEALPMLNEARKIDDAALEVNNSLALIYQGDYDTEYTDLESALFYSKKAYESFPDQNSVEIYITALYYLGLNERAENIFEQSLADYPNDADILYWGSLIKNALGKNREAEELKRKVIEIDPDNAKWFEDDEEEEEVEKEETKESLRESGKLPPIK